MSGDVPPVALCRFVIAVPGAIENQDDEDFRKLHHLGVVDAEVASELSLNKAAATMIKFDLAYLDVGLIIAEGVGVFFPTNVSKSVNRRIRRRVENMLSLPHDRRSWSRFIKQIFFGKEISSLTAWIYWDGTVAPKVGSGILKLLAARKKV
ncbi:hypothetical protein BGX26_012938 [Mortierella sp. AD094]|nr:hypothetical protein BGX26_012938 [Mortierella sp. AD094]